MLNQGGMERFQETHLYSYNWIESLIIWFECLECLFLDVADEATEIMRQTNKNRNESYAKTINTAAVNIGDKLAKEAKDLIAKIPEKINK